MTLTRAMVTPLNLFLRASGCTTRRLTRDAFDRFFSVIPPGMTDGLDAANILMSFLLNDGWEYNTSTYRAHDMIDSKTGNCLGLTCLFGAVLEECGIPVQYELVTGPYGFQRPLEQLVLDRLISGEVFPFDKPFLPTTQQLSTPLLFATLEHPRFILPHKGSEARFETTIIGEQYPSDIDGERVRPISYQNLMGLVYYERANHLLFLTQQPSFRTTHTLLDLAEKHDPHNREVWTMRADLAVKAGDQSGYNRAKEAYLALSGNDSQYFLQCHYFSNDMNDLDRALDLNPTNMHAWILKHVVYETDTKTKRANFAVAAHCVARSEIISLRMFYNTHAKLLRQLFPQEAPTLLVC